MRWLDNLTSDVEGFRKRLHQNVVFNTVINDIIRSKKDYSVGVFKDKIVLQELYCFVRHSDLKRNDSMSGEYSAYGSSGIYRFSSYGMKPLPNGVLLEAMAEEICRAIQPYCSERLTVRPWCTGYWGNDPELGTTYGFNESVLFGGSEYCYTIDATSAPHTQLKAW